MQGLTQHENPVFSLLMRPFVPASVLKLCPTSRILRVYDLTQVMQRKHLKMEMFVCVHVWASRQSRGRWEISVGQG